MPRKARKENPSTEPAPLAQLADAPPPAETPPSQPDVFDQAIAGRPAAAAATPAQEQTENAPAKQWTQHQGPRELDSVDLGDRRRLRLFRNDSLQQVAITFSAEQGVNPTPSPEDTQLLKDQGFRYRSQEKAWTRQFATPEDKERLALIEAEEGTQQAKLERNRLRVQVMQEAEQAFADLANTIRQRNGLAPTTYAAGQSQARGS